MQPGDGSGRPNLATCPACRMVYNETTNPSGCPYCAKNPGFARERALAKQEEREREQSLLGLVVSSLSSTAGRIVVILLGMVGLALFWIFALATRNVKGDGATEEQHAALPASDEQVTGEALGQNHRAVMRDARKHLLERGCAFAGVVLPDPRLAACLEHVTAACRDARPSDVEDCATNAARQKFGVELP